MCTFRMSRLHPRNTTTYIANVMFLMSILLGCQIRKLMSRVFYEAINYANMIQEVLDPCTRPIMDNGISKGAFGPIS